MGWSIQPNVLDLKLLNWKISGAQNYDKILPGQKIETDFEVEAPFAGFNYVDLDVNVVSKGQVLFKKKLPVPVLDTQFAVVPEIKDNNSVDLFVIISNQKPKSEQYTIEFSIDIPQDSNFEKSKFLGGLFDSITKSERSAVVELFGPYNIAGGETAVFAHRYRYADKFKGNYCIYGTLYDLNRNVVDKYVSTVNLED